MNSLVTRLLRVLIITKGDGIVVENSAMVASRGRGRRGRGTRGILRNGKGSRGRLIYSHSGKEGHLQNRCYDLIGWQDKTANISSSDTPSIERTDFQLISDEEYQEFLRLKSNNNTQSSTSPSVSTACISQSMENQGPWIIDLGASDRISSNEFVFSFISSPKFPYFILLANGSKMVSQGVGHVSLSSSISLNSVSYIPKCLYNLISLITFYADSFVIQDRNMGQLIDKGHESRGLYYLSNNPSMLCFASISLKLLHNRLGYLNLAKLKLKVLSLNKLSTLECESCQLGKHVRFTFLNQVNKRCNLPFSIVHSDICGPSRVTSLCFNYFVIFIDEYSRCTWVYLMKERSELLSILMSFSKEVENQFGKTIKILRSDNTKEYFSSELNSYLSSKGILHQSTCPHTPQQNGIAERKNRHLVETARTLLLSANVPTNHWGEVVLTAYF
ncbi:hypothetical protein CR513_28447, partial [Mucuna pruriens]